MAARRERGPVRARPRPGGVAVQHPAGTDGAGSPGTRGGRSRHIRSGSRSPSRASGRRARPPPVAERAQPLAMLRAPWPRGLNLAAARSPAGPGGDGECGARRLGQGRSGDFQKPELEKVSRGTQPACCGQVARSEGLLTLQAWTFSPGLGAGVAGGGGWEGYAGLPLQQDCW